MKRFLLFLCITLFCSGTLLYAENKWGVELSPQASLTNIIYSTDAYNIGGNINFVKNGVDNQSPTNQYVEGFIFGDIKNKIDNNSSWGYGVLVYTLVGTYESKKIDYDYYISPYLKYEYSFTKNFTLSFYFNLVELEYAKYENEDSSKAISGLTSAWYVAFYF